MCGEKARKGGFELTNEDPISDVGLEADSRQRGEKVNLQV